MAIKYSIQMTIPYVIKLKEEKVYSFKFKIEGFQEFNIEFLNNSEWNEDSSECKIIVLTGIYDNIEYELYTLEEATVVTNRAENVYEVTIPRTLEDELFREVSKGLNNILGYLRDELNMFWIEHLKIGKFGYNFMPAIEYNLYSPNAQLSTNCTCYKQYTYDFGEGVLEENTFEQFDNTKEYNEPKYMYLKKSQRAIFEGNYEEFIIYASISVEAFIDKYIGEKSVANNDDIIFKALSNINNDYINKYYNLLLHHFTGKSLQKNRPNSYTHIKRLYKLRNALMHSGKITSDDLRNNGIVILDDKECKKMLESIIDTFSWLNNL